MPTFLKKLGISFLVAIYLLSLGLTNGLLVSHVSAQAPASTNDTWYHQDFRNWFSRVYASPKTDVFGERYTSAQVEWIIYGFFAFLINSGLSDPDLSNCLINKPLASCAAALKTLLKLGDASTTSPQATSYKSENLLKYIFLEDRPISLISYGRNVSKNLHIIPEAKAQGTAGFGFSALSAVQPMWSAARNTSYGILVFAIIIMSFMIMFRVKINPQTVITVQSAIPKIAVALILITFSFAIAGLMVDLMYIVTGFFALILSEAYKNLGSGIVLPFADLSPSGLFSYMINGPTIAGVNTGVWGSVIIFLIYFFIGMLIAFFSATGLLGVAATAILAGAAVALSGGLIFILGAILFLIVFVMVFIMIIRILWMLIKAFVFVLLLTIVAPLQIALGIIMPQVGFGAWLKSLLGNLAVFPTAGFFIGLAFLFLAAGLGQVLQGAFGVGSGGALTGALFQKSAGWPPLLGNGTTASQGFLLMITSLVILLLLPKVADIIKSVIEGKPFAFGSAVGEAIGPIAGTGAYAAGIGLGLGKDVGTAYVASRIRGLFPGLGKYVPQKYLPGGYGPGSAPRG